MEVDQLIPAKISRRTSIIWKHFKLKPKSLLWATIAIILNIIFWTSLHDGLYRQGVRWEVVQFERSGATIAANLAKPEWLREDEHKLPGVVVLHGVLASRQWMNYVTQYLARNSMVVLNIDQSGHGSNSGTLSPENRKQDGIAAVAYLKTLKFVDPDNIAAFGWSMGGGTVGLINQADPSLLKGSILLGARLRFVDINSFNSSNPRNLLFALGRNDEIISASMVKDDLNFVLGNSATQVEEGVLYGDFTNGTARKLCLGPSDHIFEPLDGHLLKCSVEWLRSIFSIPGEVVTVDSIGGREFVSMCAGISWFALFFLIFAICGTRDLEIEDETVNKMLTNRQKYWWFLVHGATIAVCFGLGFIVNFIPIPVVYYALILGWLIFQAISFALINWKISSQAPHTPFTLRAVRPFSWRPIFIALSFAFIVFILQTIFYNVVWSFGLGVPLFKSMEMASSAYVNRYLLWLSLWIVGIPAWFYEVEVIRSRIPVWFPVDNLKTLAVNLRSLLLLVACRIWLTLLLLFLALVCAAGNVRFGSLSFSVLFVFPMTGLFFLLSLLTHFGMTYRLDSYEISVLLAGMTALFSSQILPFGSR